VWRHVASVTAGFNSVARQRGTMAAQRRAGVVLAGGYSTRFGETDKALAPVDGDPMLVRVVERIAPAVDTVVVNCRADQKEDFEAALGRVDFPVPYRFVLDSEPDRGPLAGLENALEGIEAEYAAVIACDMPWVDTALLDALFERAAGHDAAVPELPDGHLQPTQAVYRTDATLAVASERLAVGERSLRAALDTLDVAVVPSETVESVADGRSLRDVNTRSEYDSLEGT
jgi:molybdopterin-guanine dinucleotide biosynthesis protein A